MTAYFRRPLRLFPQKIHLPCAHSDRKYVKTLSFAALEIGTEIAPACPRGEIESLFSLSSLTDAHVSLTEIGAEYEKDHDFLNAARRFSFLRNLPDQLFWPPGGIDDFGGICGWTTLVLLPEVERSLNFGRLIDSWNDSLRRDFARSFKKTRRGHQPCSHRRRYKTADE